MQQEFPPLTDIEITKEMTIIMFPRMKLSTGGGGRRV